MGNFFVKSSFSVKILLFIISIIFIYSLFLNWQNVSAFNDPNYQPVLTATVGTGQIDLSWTTDASSTQYLIHTDPSMNNSTDILATLSGITSSYTVSGLTAETYYYYIEAIDDNNNIATSSVVSPAVLIGIPRAPSMQSPNGITAVNNASLNFQWSGPVAGDNSIPDKYNLYLATTTMNSACPADNNNNFSFFKSVNFPTLNTSLDSLTGNVVYCFLVSAENNAGESKKNKPVSAIAQSWPTIFSTLVSGPSFGSSTNFKISWQAAPDQSVFQYVITQTYLLNGQTQIITAAIPASATSSTYEFIFTGFNEYDTVYDFNIYAENQYGIIYTSPTQSVTTTSYTTPSAASLLIFPGAVAGGISSYGKYFGSDASAYATDTAVVAVLNKINNKMIDTNKIENSNSTKIVTNNCFFTNTNASTTNIFSEFQDFKFSRNLYRYMKGKDVLALQKFLNNNGFKLEGDTYGSPGKETEYFGPRTQRALIHFQEANSELILKPYGLTKGTGHMSKYSRRKLNFMLESGCKKV